MPVTTRSMKKSLPGYNLVRTTAIQKNPLSISVLLGVKETDQETNFIQQTKNLLFECQIVQGKEAKMRVSLQIFKNVNNTLYKLLTGNQIKWIKFAATVYSKTTEFYNDMLSGQYNEIGDKKLVANHCQEFMKTRNFLVGYFTNLKKTLPSLIDMNDKFIAKAMQEIEKSAAMIRPHRSVPRVDYTGMDTIEPESEYDGITDIWYDETVWYDSDYEPDEDEQDEDEDEYEVDVEPPKTVASCSRLKRNIRRVDYSGMDMGEEDEGSVSVCVVKWNNRVPSYRWVKYPASKANELFDEDWQC
jgi:hypothetical protein